MPSIFHDKTAQDLLGLLRREKTANMSRVLHRPKRRVPREQTMWLAKVVNASIVAGGSGEVEMWEANGPTAAPTATGRIVTAWLHWATNGITLPVGTEVFIARIDPQYVITGWECM